MSKLLEFSAGRRAARFAGRHWSCEVMTVPAALLSEVAAAGIALPPPDGRALVEAGALAYRRHHGEIEILLISKKRSKKWGIPKGRAEPHLSFSELAAKEAYEEAGVIGRVSASPIGVFRAKRRSADDISRQIIEVWVYLFEVTDSRARWPEMKKREVRWVSCRAAAGELHEPLLAQLCHRLAQLA